MELNSAKKAYRGLNRKAKAGLSPRAAAALEQCSDVGDEIDQRPLTIDSARLLSFASDLMDAVTNGEVFEWELLAFWLLLLREDSNILHELSQKSAFLELYLQLLDHAEPRIRQLCISLLSFLQTVQGGGGSNLLYDKLGNALLSRIRNKFVRVSNSQTLRLGTEVTVPLDDTTGWSSLESSLLAYHELICCCDSTVLLVTLGDTDVCSLIITNASVHQNRFVREATIMFIRSTCVMLEMATAYVKSMIVSDQLAIRFIDALRLGLEDNWSRIRQASCNATLAFAKVFDFDGTRSGMIRKKLLPGVCLSRFYAAEGVKSAALESWRGLVGAVGREILSNHIDFFISDYAESSKSNNHMVSEASCSAMAEILCRIDREVVLPHLRPLVEALAACLSDDSWPVRDASCTATGSLLQYYGAESVKISPNLLSFFFSVCTRNLKDTIWSLRDNAAVALANAMQGDCFAITSQATSLANSFLRENLDKALLEPSGSKTPFLQPAQLALLTGSSPQGRIDQPVKSIWRKGGGWGCCLDCMDTREGDSADMSSGAVFLLRETARVNTGLAVQHLEKLWLLLDMKLKTSNSSKQEKFLIGVLEQLPEILKPFTVGDKVSGETLTSLTKIRSKVENLVVDASRDLSYAAKQVLSELPVIKDE